METNSQALRSFPYFMENIFSKYYEYTYGRWISGDYIRNVAFLMQNQDHLVLALPRGHSKTTLILGYLSWIVYTSKQNGEALVSLNMDPSYIERVQDMFAFFGFDPSSEDYARCGAISVKNPHTGGSTKIVFGLPLKRFDTILIDDMNCAAYARQSQKTIALGTPKVKSDLFDRADLKFTALNNKNEALFPELYSEVSLYRLADLLGSGFLKEYMCEV